MGQRTWVSEQYTPEDAWRKWLTSTMPRKFEAGIISPQEFASGIVSELKMSVSPADFLDFFEQWPIGPYPGALDMLHALKINYRVALFSNSSEIHWQRKMDKMELRSAFHEHFASHLIGLVKPDKSAFRYVIAQLNAEPHRILFLDDNQLNVDAAIAAGMLAERVQGLQETQDSLRKHSVSWH